MVLAIGGNLLIDQDQVADLCRRFHIRELAVFGSAVAGPFTDGSDVDLLYEFEAGHTAGFQILKIEEEFSRLLGGRRIDLMPKKYLNRHVRDRILSTARTLYAQG